ncbi:MAG: twin-arginine translocase TatA/TatE family subunit [Bradymonadales bacterium]|nr:twin-arginine translocase TatA/TatE family subunit [Bradymonadales bacterium]
MSTQELIVVLIVALVVLGPDHLPAIARALGKMMREFRKATREIETTLEMEDVRRTIRQRVEEEKASLLDGTDPASSAVQEGKLPPASQETSDEEADQDEPGLKEYLAGRPTARTEDGAQDDPSSPDRGREQADPTDGRAKGERVGAQTESKGSRGASGGS